MDEFLKYSTLLFWVPWMFKRVLESLCFWQRKEYRLDRAREEIGRRPGTLVPKSVYLSILLLVLFFLTRNWWGAKAVVFAFYFILGSYAVYRFKNRGVALPKFTKKAVFLLLAAVCLLLMILWLFFSSFFLFALALETGLFFFLSAIILCAQLPTFFAKKWIEEKAKRKINDLEESVTVIGITGSYGKSSTKEFLYKILSQKFKVLKTEKNINTAIGVAKTVLGNLDGSYDFFICEMGAYKKGEIKSICEIVKPKIGILTGINEQHLALFGSQENIIKGKFELIEALPESGWAVLNTENEYINRTIHDTQYSIRIIECEINKQIQDLEIGKESISFKIDGVGFALNLAGAHNVENLFLAICCARELGMSLGEISDTCRKIKPFRRTMEIKKGRRGVDIIDDTYSANPQGVKAALEHLKLWEGSKIVVMPCLIELGSSAKKVHYEIGERIGEICDMAVITTGDYFKDIKEGALNAGMEQEKIVQLRNSDMILKKLQPFLKKGNVVLLGSRVPEALIKTITQP